MMSVLAESLQNDVFTAKKPKVDSEGLEQGIGNMNDQKLFVKKLSTHATVPTRGSTQAAGYDLYR